MGFRIRCLPTFQHVNCCCCQCALKTGTLIIGILEVISGVAEAIHGTVELVIFDGKHIPERHHYYGHKPDTPIAYQATMTVEILVGLFIAVIGVAIIYAVNKEKAGILEPILKLELVGIVLSIVFGSFFSIKSFRENVIMGTIILVTMAIAIGASFMLWLIVYSFYRQLVEQTIPQQSNCPRNIPQAAKRNEREQGI